MRNDHPWLSGWRCGGHGLLSILLLEAAGGCRRLKETTRTRRLRWRTGRKGRTQMDEERYEERRKDLGKERPGREGGRWKCLVGGEGKGIGQEGRRNRIISWIWRKKEGIVGG